MSSSNEAVTENRRHGPESLSGTDSRPTDTEADRLLFSAVAQAFRKIIQTLF